MKTLAVTLAQINPHVGDIHGNQQLIMEAISEGVAQRSQLIVLPELAISGYPPEDLLLRPHFVRACEKAIAEIASALPQGVAALVGTPWLDQTDLYNAVAVLADGEIQGVYRKMFLPNYGVFDEQRYFAKGQRPGLININGVPVGITVCEDIWVPQSPELALSLAGAQLVINLSASPYHIGKGQQREQMLSQRCRDTHTTLVYVNQTGGQDELVFDGQSLVVDHNGVTTNRLPQFTSIIQTVEVRLDAATASRLRDPHNRSLYGIDTHLVDTQQLPLHPSVETIADLSLPTARTLLSYPTLLTEPLDPDAEAYAALVLGTRDYVRKNGFQDVVFGMSGGIDSALVSLIAVDALGPEHVRCLVMPSTYSSHETQSDAEVLAANLGIDCQRVEIAPLMATYDQTLAPLFGDMPADVTEENIQARIRGNLLLALSNKFGSLVLTTGNRSEMACGYATLAGDLTGGLGVLIGCPKLLVYRLVQWRNQQAGGTLVPLDIITREPSAELRPDQADSDSLPEYEILDPIIALYMEQEYSLKEIVAEGYDYETVKRILGLINNAEFKRRQAPPGIKLTPRSYGRDWRLPITNGYRQL